jgi:hypothetical protein
MDQQADYLDLFYNFEHSIIDYGYNISITAIEQNQIYALDWLKEIGYEFTADIYYSAMECDNYDALYWLLINDITSDNLADYEQYNGQYARLRIWLEAVLI